MPKVIEVPRQEVEFERENPMTFQTVKAKWGFKEWALRCIHNYDFFGKGLENILQGSDIRKAVEACDGTLELGQSDYDKFWKAVEDRRANQQAAEACLPFHLAVKNAKEKEEEKK